MTDEEIGVEIARLGLFAAQVRTVTTRAQLKTLVRSACSTATRVADEYDRRWGFDA